MFANNFEEANVQYILRLKEWMNKEKKTLTFVKGGVLKQKNTDVKNSLFYALRF